MQQLIKNILFVVIIAGCCGLLLSAINEKLATKYLENNQKFLCEQILLAANIPSKTPIKTVKEIVENVFIDNQLSSIEKLLNSKILPNNFLLQPYNKKFVIIGLNGSGLWGPIRGILATDSTFKKIIGFTILEMNETPGLGAQYKDLNYLKNFNGKNPSELRIISPRDKIDDVDAVTGATYTGRAIEHMIHSHQDYYKQQEKMLLDIEIQ